MPLEVTQLIDAPPGAVWDELTRVSRWSRWGPSVVDVECDDECIRRDSRGRVRTALGFWLPFEVTAMEPGRSWRWRVGGIPATGHRVEPEGPGRCRLVFEIPWWAALYAPVCRAAANRIARICAATTENEPD